MITTIFRWSYKCQSWENERLRHQMRGVSLVTDFELCLWEKRPIKRLRPRCCVRGRLSVRWTCGTLRGRFMSSVRKTRTESICLCHIRVSMWEKLHSLATIHHQYCLRPFVSFQSFSHWPCPICFWLKCLHGDMTQRPRDSKKWANETISTQSSSFVSCC